MIKPSYPFDVIVYATKSGKEPYTQWIKELKDISTATRIMKRVGRLSLGNMGDYKSLGGGIFELRLDFGSGYRVYFGRDGEKIIVLLCAGSKRTQAQDIKKARAYWAQYEE